MFSVESLEFTISNLFRGGISKENGYYTDVVEDLLDSIDFYELAQAVRHYMRAVYSYSTESRLPKSFNYRGPDLFGQNAVCLYEDFDQLTAEAVTASRSIELWLLEDMTFAPGVCVTVSWGDGAYSTEYRVVKECDPWQSGMTLDLAALASTLRLMCVPAFEREIPVYEL